MGISCRGWSRGRKWRLTDDGKGGYDTGEGTIIWINDKAEFTPKTIQTKNERANMVYATKIKVKMTVDTKSNVAGSFQWRIIDRYWQEKRWIIQKINRHGDTPNNISKDI